MIQVGEGERVEEGEKNRRRGRKRGGEERREKGKKN